MISAANTAPIAIVEDDPQVALLIADMLKSLGFKTAVHHSAEAYLQARSGQRYLALVLDLSLPRMDGLELLHLLAQGPHTEPLVMVSGLSKTVLNAAYRVAQNLGFAVLGHLTKPFRLAELAQVLNVSLKARPPVTGARYIPTEADLQRAIERQELQAYMQPQVQFGSNELVGMEALVRWHHPQHGLVLPSHFIALAESAGLALSITELITRQALQIADRARGFGFKGSLSINLAPVSLTDPEFPNAMEKLVQGSQWPLQQLCFEVTETSVARDPDLALAILTRLAIKGFRLAVDDFGTGHSSMEKLDQLPLSEMKIDMGFIQRAFTDDRARVIVEESIVLGHKLGMQVVAEGVETPAQWRWLAQQGCDVAQGYYLSRPVPAEQVASFDRDWVPG